MIPIGSTVQLKNWPVPGKVIGHHDGAPIIQPEACTVSDEQIVSYTDEKGLTRIPFYQKFSDEEKELPDHRSFEHYRNKK